MVDKYITKTIGISTTTNRFENQTEDFGIALNNPPKGYYVHDYFCVPGDEDAYRVFLVIYKLNESDSELVKGTHRKFKGEHGN